MADERVTDIVSVPATVPTISAAPPPSPHRISPPDGGEAGIASRTEQAKGERTKEEAIKDCEDLLNGSENITPDAIENALKGTADHGLPDLARKLLTRGYRKRFLSTKPEDWLQKLIKTIRNDLGTGVEEFVVCSFLGTGPDKTMLVDQLKTLTEFLKFTETQNVISIVCNKEKEECIILRVAKAVEKNADSPLKLAGIDFLRVFLEKNTYRNYVDATLLCGHCYHEKQSGKIDPEKHGKTLYNAIADTGVDELKLHPCFVAAVEYRWTQKYYYQILHWVQFLIYILFVACFTTALVLAARSSDNDNDLDRFRATCETVVLLYSAGWIMFATFGKIFFIVVRTRYRCKDKEVKFVKLPCRGNLTNAIPQLFQIFKQRLSVPLIVNWGGYILILVWIIPRLSGSDWQWLLASLAFICNGFRLFLYIRVLPDLGRFITILYIVLKRDMLWLVGVFFILNFTIGGGFFLALLGFSNSKSSNGTESSEIYHSWERGFQLISGTSAAAPDNISLFAGMMYWFFVVMVNILFASILISQLSSTFTTGSGRADKSILLAKCTIMREIDERLLLFKMFDYWYDTKHGFQEHSDARKAEGKIENCSKLPLPKFADSKETEFTELLVSIKQDIALLKQLKES